MYLPYMKEILHSTLQLYLQRDTLGNNDEKIKMGNHLLSEERARGAGQAYAHPPLPLSAALDANTKISLKILRLK